MNKQEVSKLRGPLPGPGFRDFPGVDMYAEDGQLITEVLLPEFKEDEICILATSEGLEISAVRDTRQRRGENKKYFMQEGRQSYWRHLSIPRTARPEQTSYAFDGTKLRIIMPIGNEEVGHERPATAEDRGVKVVVQTDPEFSNHWVRYRPARRTPRV